MTPEHTAVLMSSRTPPGQNNSKVKLKQQRSLTIVIPFAVEELKDSTGTSSPTLELRNRFEMLSNTKDIERNGSI
ncbi:hypothetical protein ANCDUO_12279 [Ancylostoma duodenale]|uniref:Uncharacterized protein n=1 Tax=Ancylostoma duodenale TaxID=51022 RepID=A0A0C2GKC8_9BILA|nr:hypothetical protein ANCDUO_12279 [Ancylostoma duodenale]